MDDMLAWLQSFVSCNFYKLKINNYNFFITFTKVLLLQFLAQISAQSSMLTNRKIKPPSQQSPSINSTIKTSSGGNLVLANKQAAPKFSYVVWDEQGMVCILAKFEATLTITFYTPSGAHVNIFGFLIC